MRKITLANITKSFTLEQKAHRNALAKSLALFSKTPASPLAPSAHHAPVLRSLSLDVDAGDILGIIGNNGCGKSTLLRIIAGIYEPDSGSVITHGKVVSIINLGTGLRDRLTMRDNIYLVGSLFGMSNQAIRESFDSIVDFSELGDFIDAKIFQFSLGMAQRLAFSIAIHSNPDILLCDEVFEVGDEHFRKKSADKIRSLASAGMAVILVSHDMDIIEKNCNRIVRIEDGSIVPWQASHMNESRRA